MSDQIKFSYRGTPVQIDDVFTMRGVKIASVTAAQPIFVTDGRYPGRPTRFYWVKVADLTLVSSVPVQEVVR